MNYKNHSKNAFFFYKQQFERENIGKIFDRGITDIEVAAIESWRKLTLQQREPFVEMVKKGAPIPKVTKLKKNETIVTEGNKTIYEFISQSLKNKTLPMQEYYLIAANVFCETKSKKYCPAELALLKFTLQDGVIRTFHTYVNPENIPLGYRFDATAFSNETHQLPIPPNAKGEKNFAKILQQMKEFVGIKTSTKPSPEIVLMFTLEEHVKMVQSICEDLCSSTNASGRFEILSVNQLFFELKAAAVRGGSKFVSIDDATIQLNQEKYLYLNAIACQYHDENDCSKYCCLSSVKRWAYIISENVCIDFNIRLIAGKHYPVGVDYPTQLSENISTNNDASHSSTAANNIVSLRDIMIDRQVDLNENFDALDHGSLVDGLRETTLRDRLGRRVNFGGGENYHRRCFGRGRMSRGDEEGIH